MSKYRATAADRRVADDTHAEQELMCAAHGCPNRWSVDGARGRCCSAHAWSEHSLWPRITEAQQHRASQAAFERSQRHHEEAPAPRYTLTADAKREIWRQAIGKLSAIVARRTGRGWAQRLRAREDRGYATTATQRTMVQTAIGARQEVEQEAA